MGWGHGGAEHEVEEEEGISGAAVEGLGREGVSVDRVATTCLVLVEQAVSVGERAPSFDPPQLSPSILYRLLCSLGCNHVGC